MTPVSEKSYILIKSTQKVMFLTSVMEGTQLKSWLGLKYSKLPAVFDHSTRQVSE
jgi:hypothetical protein